MPIVDDKLTAGYMKNLSNDAMLKSTQEMWDNVKEIIYNKIEEQAKQGLWGYNFEYTIYPQFKDDLNLKRLRHEFERRGFKVYVRSTFLEVEWGE